MDVPLYRLCDAASGVLILFMAVFGPWAFGTTLPSSIWLMNYAAYALGALLLVKLFIRKIKKCPFPRWDETVAAMPNKFPSPAQRATVLLAWLTVVLLLYCLISALNAAASYDPSSKIFVYHDHSNKTQTILRLQWWLWLPRSFDATRTWFWFWIYLGLAAAFWSTRDWLLGKTEAEEKSFRTAGGEPAVPRLNARMRQLLWVLAISGTALGIESIIQRVSGSTKLLFLVQPLVNPEGITQFGPYAYRANAAQYFNLLWPLVLGGWWLLRRHGGKIHLLPVGAIVMAACPVISTSRGGALVAAGLLVALAVIFLALEFSARRHRRGNFPRARRNLLLTLVFLGLVAGLGGYFGWKELSPRLEQLDEGFSGREQIYADARPMAADYPFFGTGPGTFGTVFQLYRISNLTYWPEQLHNDWLETLITFGWVGMLLLMVALGCVAVAGWFAPRRLFIAAGLALAGCLVHARFDFPFQIHSIIFLFLLIAAWLMAAGAVKRPRIKSSESDMESNRRQPASRQS